MSVGEKVAKSKSTIEIRINSLSIAREFYWSPDIEIEKDITDSAGKILYHAGSKIKPYKEIKLGNLLLLDGTNILHVKWALLSKKNKPHSTLMLIKGSGDKLSAKHGTEFIEDKSHYFLNKFGVKNLPAIILQEGDRICVREINIK